MQLLPNFNRSLNRHAGALFLGGLVLVGLHNWRLWQRDRALAERLRAEREPQPQLADTPMVSALVAAWNEAAHIDAHIRSFQALAYPQIELIICAGGTDDTLARARAYAGPRITVLEQRPGEGKQRALARCYEHARGEIIYLTDADCLFDAQALLRLLAPIVNDGEQVSTGRVRPLPNQEYKQLPAYLWAIDTAASAYSDEHINGLLGANTAIARSAFQRSGGLDFVACTGTDYQLGQRLLAAGIAIRFVGNSIVPSEYPQSLSAYRHRQSRWLRNLLLYGPQFGARRDVRLTLQTIGLGWLMLLLPLSSMILGPLALLLWSLLVTHATFSRLRYIRLAAHLSALQVRPTLLLSVLPLTLVDFFVWALPALDLLDPRRRSRW